MSAPMILWHLLHSREKIKRRKRKTGRNTLRRNNNNSYNGPEPSDDAQQLIETKEEKRVFKYEQNTCRVCLQCGDIPIYGVIDVSDDLQLLTGIEVTPDDSYPQYLCESCSNQLEGAISLRKTAQNSDQLLKQATQDIINNALGEDGNIVEENNDVPIINNNADNENDGVYESDENHDDWLYTIQKTEKIHDDEEESDYDDNKREQNRRKLKDKDNVPLADLLREFTERKEANMVFEEVRTKTFHCVKCNIGYETMEGYSEHMAKEHDDIRETCPVCNNKYTHRYLKKHLALHKQEKPYMCDICGKNFKVKGQFTRHRTTHFITELPFKCSECPYRGRFRENLNLHMRTHTNDKRYQCPQCPARYFINKSNLSRHMLTHKTDHDFKCDQCQRGFYTKRDLELHFKVDHSGIKDHVCNECGKAFGLRKQLMKHQRKVHKRAKMRSGRTPLYMLLESKKQQEEPSAQETSGQDCSFENNQDIIRDITIHVNI
ncbi:hypothetical protein O0L34_g14534 [Tuta absoluta]|nr:hypothetical protein O0L34_g14534 [Tuta absoluta]